MSREVKRVALDFEWPLGKVWEGYLLPGSLQESPCPEGAACNNGRTTARAWVEEIAHLALMLDDDLSAQRRGRPMHPYFQSVPGGGPYGSRGRPSPDIREFGVGLAGREGTTLGHDALDGWRASKALIQAAGLDPDAWGICQTCKGHARVESYPGQRAAAEAWEPTGPPIGEGWQLWETVSEGSPVSPVFATDEELARWLTTTEGGAAAGPSRRPLTIEQARGFVGVGWAPSGIGNTDGFHDGAEYVGTQQAVGDLFSEAPLQAGEE